MYVPAQLFHSRTKRSMACMSAAGPAGKDLTYNDIIELKQKNKIILIDVREASEIEETGKLPGSIHIPRKFLTFMDSVPLGIHDPVGHAWPLISIKKENSCFV
jgi:hypothetical protein